MIDETPDQWKPGLRMEGKVLNIKRVRRASCFADVLPVCLAHNLRQGNEAHRHRSPIDPARTGANEVLRGPASLPVAVELVRNAFDDLGIVPARADAIAGIELVFQPPDGHATPAFWSACLCWVDCRYQHVLSAVVHHDQSRPHMHVIALAVANGRLAGHALTSGANLLQCQRREFMAHVFAVLGLRPNRRAVDPLKKLALSTGKGAKTRAGAARRDAELTRASASDWKRDPVCMAVGAADVHGGPVVEKGNRHAHEKCRPPYCATFPAVEPVPESGTKPPVSKATPATPTKPCPAPLQAGKTTRKSNARTTADRLQNIGHLFTRCRAVLALHPLQAC